MFSARLIKLIVLPGLLLSALLGLTSCDGITDDLKPSGDDKRPSVEAGTIGTQVGQQSPDWSLYDTLGNSRGLYDELTKPGVTGVVLYFTMWCPVCEVHMDDMRANVMLNFPTVSFFLVDYVSGSISISLATQQAYGYTSINTLVDTDQTVLDLYQATMGTTVVISSAGNIVEMNEDYKDGVKLTETLQALP